jgi:hypothetical protein
MIKTKIDYEFIIWWIFYKIFYKNWHGWVNMLTCQIYDLNCEIYTTLKYEIEKYLIKKKRKSHWLLKSSFI